MKSLRSIFSAAAWWPLCCLSRLWVVDGTVPPCPSALNAAADLRATQGNAAVSFARAASRLMRAASPPGTLNADFEVGSTILTPLPRYGLAAANQQFVKNAQPA